MSFKDLATQLVLRKVAGANSFSDAESALDQLVDGSKGFDIGALVKQLQGCGSDLAARTSSWLSDGANEPVSAAQIKEAMGTDKIAAFATRLGISGDEASEKLAQILPDLVDKSSRGGKLLRSIGGPRGLLAGITSRFLKKSA